MVVNSVAADALDFHAIGTVAGGNDGVGGEGDIMR